MIEYAIYDAVIADKLRRSHDMRYIILWALGVPVIALVALHLLGVL
jgi:hypothetical protein